MTNLLQYHIVGLSTHFHSMIAVIAVAACGVRWPYTMSSCIRFQLKFWTNAKINKHRYESYCATNSGPN